MKSQFMFSGIGGQGIISIGELICMAANEKEYTVTFTPCYGQEKRGGRTMCQMTVSNKMGSPIISEADLLLVMDEKSLKDYEKIVKKDGYLIINSNLVDSIPGRKDISVIKVPCNDIALETGNVKVANIVALGAALKFLTFVSPKEVCAQLIKIFSGPKEKLIPLNEKALNAGYGYIETIKI